MWNIPQGGLTILVHEGLTAELAKLPRKREADLLVGASGTQRDGSMCRWPWGTAAPRRMPSRSTAWWRTARRMRQCGRMCYTISPALEMPRISSGPAVISRSRASGRDRGQCIPTRRLVDLDPEYAGSEERCSRGYTRGEEATATRIDGMLAHPRTASTVSRVEHIPSKGIPRHRPVCFDLALEATCQEVLRVPPLHPPAPPLRAFKEGAQLAVRAWARRSCLVTKASGTPCKLPGEWMQCGNF